MDVVNIVHHTWEEQWIYNFDGQKLETQTFGSWSGGMKDVIQRDGGENNIIIMFLLGLICSMLEQSVCGNIGESVLRIGRKYGGN